MTKRLINLIETKAKGIDNEYTFANYVYYKQKDIKLDTHLILMVSAMRHVQYNKKGEIVFPQIINTYAYIATRIIKGNKSYCVL